MGSIGSGKFIMASSSVLVAPDATFFALCLFMNCRISSSAATSSSSITLGDALDDREIGVADPSLAVDAEDEDGILETGRESLEVSVLAGEGATWREALARSLTLAETDMVVGLRTGRLSRTTFLAAAEAVSAAAEDEGGTGRARGGRVLTDPVEDDGWIVLVRRESGAESRPKSLLDDLYCRAVAVPEGVAPSSSSVRPNSDRLDEVLLLMPLRMLPDDEMATLLRLEDRDAAPELATGTAGGPMLRLEMRGIFVGVWPVSRWNEDVGSAVTAMDEMPLTGATDGEPAMVGRLARDARVLRS